MARQAGILFVASASGLQREIEASRCEIRKGEKHSGLIKNIPESSLPNQGE